MRNKGFFYAYSLSSGVRKKIEQFIVGLAIGSFLLQWPERVRKALPVLKSQILMVLSLLPVATALFPCTQKTNLGVRLVAIAKKIQRYYPALQDLQQLRYSRIALWLKSQAPRWVQYQAGFADLQALHKFQQGRLEALQNAIERFHPF